MNHLSEFLIYVTCFRLAVIAAGVVSIVLGYRLFVAGVRFDRTISGETTFDAKVAGQGFALKNAAPGTGFGLFGVIIISVMLVQGSPELTLKTFDKVAAAADSSAADTSRSTEFVVRGSGKSEFELAAKKGLDFDRRGDMANAVASYEEAMATMATPMNQLAWDYLQLGRTEDALPLSLLAAHLCPGRAAFVETLAEILDKEGKHDEALQWMSKAAALDPKYKERLSRMQRPAKQ